MQDGREGRQRGERVPLVLIWLAVFLTLPELILQAADLGLIGSARWRPLAYQNFAFWVGLLQDWRPNYALQPYAMFVTYSVLHGGLGHLVGNLAALAVLGPIVVEQAGPRGFLAVWILSVLGGAVAFGLLSSSPQPMVGASGALFGLAGAWLAWDGQEARRLRAPLWPVLGRMAGLVLLNGVLWVLQGGQLAWETHLGGFAAGWIWAMWVAPSPRPIPENPLE